MKKKRKERIHKRLNKQIKDSMNKAKSEESASLRNSNFIKFNLNKISIILNNIKKRSTINTESTERKISSSIFNKIDKKDEINMDNNNKINDNNNSAININISNKINDNNNSAINISNKNNNSNRINTNNKINNNRINLNNINSNKINKIIKIHNIKKSDIKTSFNDLKKKKNIIYIKKLNENNNKKSITNISGKITDKKNAKNMFKSILDRKRRFHRIINLKNNKKFS